jgi:hypothetical protein
VHLEAKYQGFCNHCGMPYLAGDQILWLGRRGATHDHKECESYWYLEDAGK